MKGTNTCTYATSIFFFHFQFPFFFFFNFQFSFPIFILNFYFQFSFFQFSFPIFINFMFNFQFPGVLPLGVGVNRTFCAFVSREFYWTSTAAMHIMSVSLSWRRSGAAALAKPRDILSVRLCCMDVSTCARLRPFRLSGFLGRVCKHLGSPVDDLLPASSRACVL